MDIFPIGQIIPESNIVVFAPHFDDTLFMLGGYVLEMKAKGLLHTKKFHIQLIFPRSNYLARSGTGNYDRGLERLKLATGQRIIEELDCLDELFGAFGYRYELARERECFARGKGFANSKMEFPYGTYEDFDDEDLAISRRTKERVCFWARQSDTALVFPLAIMEHIDHFIVREAGACVAAELGAKAKASFYFQEDKPYGGIANTGELERTKSFISSHKISMKIYEYNSEEVIDLAFKHYISQVEDVYREGIQCRGDSLRKCYRASRPCDRIGKMQL